MSDSAMSNEENHSMPHYLDTREVAALTRRSVRTIYELSRGGRIPLRQPSGTNKLLYPRDEVIAWIEGAPLEVLNLADGGRVVRPLREAA